MEMRSWMEGMNRDVRRGQPSSRNSGGTIETIIDVLQGTVPSASAQSQAIFPKQSA